jgi:hypothetical protein
MRTAFLSAAIFLAGAVTAHAKAPVIVELYTSQGCSSCGEANELVETLAARDDLIPLTFTVDYWDYLGWRDTFAKPEFSERQRRYAARLAPRGVFTPQVVIDGALQAKATEADKVDRLIETAAQEPHDSPDIRFIGDRIAVGSSGRRVEAEVWLIRYDPNGREVEVKRGENRGKTITYRNVVCELVRLGSWTGRPVSFKTPEAKHDGLETLILVQERGGPVLASLAEKSASLPPRGGKGFPVDHPHPSPA